MTNHTYRNRHGRGNPYCFNSAGSSRILF
jgi:hypothetical protein